MKIPCATPGSIFWGDPHKIFLVNYPKSPVVLNFEVIKERGTMVAISVDAPGLLLACASDLDGLVEAIGLHEQVDPEAVLVFSGV